MASVSIQNLIKVYGEDTKDPFRAVKGIDLEIRDKEFMVFVGPSGCGKSTTLRMIAGLEDITDGVLRIDDRIVNDVAPKSRDIAMVFQNYALYPHMTIYDNMAFGLKLLKYPKEEIRNRVLDAAEVLGLTSMLKRKPKALSGGQRQRVAVGRAIVRKPKVFLFDEPLSNLDAKMRVQMRTEISKLHHRLDATMIYVTHDQTEAMTMGDRICVMKDGDIMQVDGPLELYNQPRNMFVAGFIGSPPMNFFKGHIIDRGGQLFFHEAGGADASFTITLDRRLAEQAAAYVGRSVVFGIRPEDIFDATAEEAVAGTEVLAKIDVAEPMGAETYLYFDTASHHFIGRVGGDYKYEMGREMRVGFNLLKVHLFDPETELTLAPFE